MSNAWDEFEKSTESNGDSKKPAFNRIDFKNTETQIRLLSDNYVKRLYHFVQTGSKGSGKPVICCGEGCPVCAIGNEPSPKWLFPALDRNTLNVGVVQLPLTVMRGINRLRKLQMFGPDIKTYDILILKDITTGKDGRARTQYQVQGIPKQATPKLADDVKARIVEELKGIDIEAISKPYSPEQTIKYLGWQQQPEAVQAPVQARPVVSAPVAQPVAQAAPKKSAVDISKFLSEEEPEAESTFDGSVDGSGSDDPLEI